MSMANTGDKNTNGSQFFLNVANNANLDWFKPELEKIYELKEAARLGPAEGDDKETTVLNLVVRWTPQGLEMEADPKQAEKLLRYFKLNSEPPRLACARPREQHSAARRA